MAVTTRLGGYAMLSAAMLALAACEVKQAQAPTNTSGNAAAPATVVRETSAPADQGPPVAPMAAATVLQSQPGPEGSQLDLLKVAVTGDILTVTLRCSSTDRVNTESFALKDISIIDDATSQRIAVLKDNGGQWLASNVSGDRIMVGCEEKPGILWAKFAAPSAGAKTVSINLPQVAPFDGVPVTR